jgi:hypothetical protein
VTPDRHGGSVPIPAEALLADDPDLALATADLHAWAAAHPCDCEALCECDNE